MIMVDPGPERTRHLTLGPRLDHDELAHHARVS